MFTERLTLDDSIRQIPLRKIPLHRIPRILTAPFRPPERANVANPTKYERARFSFTYPGNWQIDTSSKHYDPDTFLILDAPREGQVRLQILDAEIDPRDAAQQIASRFQFAGLRLTDRSEFSTWGRFNGHGLSLSGKYLGDPFLGRIFVYGGATQSLAVWEFWWDGPDSINATGFKLIEDSFRLDESGNR